MRLTTKGRYAVTAMLDLALHGVDRPVSLADISGRQDISLSYLEQLFAKLRRNNLVSSVRGPGGGYRLSRGGHEIFVAQIIDAVNEVTRERAQSFLASAHQQRILAAYKTFADVPGFAKVATLAEIGGNGASLSIPLYVKRFAAAGSTDSNGDAVSLRSAWAQWQNDGRAFWQQMHALVETLDGLIAGDIERV